VTKQSSEHIEKLFTKTLEYVLRAPKTEKQVRDWLWKKRKDGEFLDIDEIINRIKDLGYINDADYVQRFTEVKSQKIGERCIKQKLMVKGVTRDLIDTVDAGDQTELCKSLAEKYMRNKTADQKTLQKLYRFLLSKGFGYDTVSYVVNSPSHAKGWHRDCGDGVGEI
jgi:regulatory protein